MSLFKQLNVVFVHLSRRKDILVLLKSEWNASYFFFFLLVDDILSIILPFQFNFDTTFILVFYFFTVNSFLYYSGNVLLVKPSDLELPYITLNWSCPLVLLITFRFQSVFEFIWSDGTVILGNYFKSNSWVQLESRRLLTQTHPLHTETYILVYLHQSVKMCSIVRLVWLCKERVATFIFLMLLS